MWIYLLMWTSLICNINSEHVNIIPDYTICQPHEIPDHKENNVLLRVHNCLRNKIRFINEDFPRGTNLLKMEWNDTLYQMAAQYVRQCSEKSDCSKKSIDLTGDVEQNFKAVVYNKTYEENDSIQNFINIIRGWAFEIIDLPGNIVQNFQSEKSPGKNWVNLFRATTFQVGCDSTYYQLDNEKYKEIYACNYAPAKLTEGEEIYKTGNWCTECPAGMNCHTTYFRLCAPMDDVTVQPKTILWECDFSEGMKEQCEYEIQCYENWKIVCEFENCYQEIILDEPKSSLLFLTPIYVKDQACLTFNYKKEQLPENIRESTLTAIAVWDKGENYTSVIIREDVNIWTTINLNIPVKDKEIRIGFVARKEPNSVGEKISIENVFVLSGLC